MIDDCDLIGYGADPPDPQCPGGWVSIRDARHLIIPYSFETNDNRFDQNIGFSTARISPAT